ncbi:uncharacterized protein N7506_008490 [Penicillium brevicompactum]|uniref:uncharacterized protein n=1 Tax=Penicillium brevicompactum TaxID=5074 RepID=UPI0025408ED7|nr:uncharacterized protein N7506_008490 [Penicillium brevicompactum]KAJ5325388.1 hypothetical protein N7506_008490 [Penicillium brevicompactum]
MGGLTGIANGTASSSEPSSLQQWDFMFSRPDQRTFLAPESHQSTRRGSLGAETFSSPFAWPTVLNRDILSNSSQMSSFEAPTGSELNAPFMPAYDRSGALPTAINTPSMSGYNHQQIGKWCIDSTPTEDLYPPQSFPDIGSLVPTEPYFTFNDVTEMSISSSPPRSLSDPDSPPAPSSASNASDLSNYGIPTSDGLWRCAHPGCSSQLLFKRGCDLRKHFNRHRKYLFCRYEKCAQSTQNGFSSKKDRARHEAKHNPGVICEWDGCGKVFSRVDNMKDHVRRIHQKGKA